ncbi:DUF6412 domain-containing protein [Actinosynnema sp. NPDC047251]|uniref:Putative secreted protein n=1 Tax=Saccharothrix espanaensis (strain ATCC 51144 / DSM 44229 / JCM 9112 / NBRC 15066 / NRRL 15764) TaxID=1179773 RepID=K0JPF6_SACES|nr:DUF6412 domain-containing protein [Saccharothrix espanaensis]CCH28615.1 putative secreted protein [Saccharothrix espanaensis DSM 44229]
MARLQVLLALWLPGLFALTLPHSPADLLAVVTAVAVVLLLLSAAPTAQTVPTWARSLSLREKALKSAFLRLRDPDAAGRPRPRAPGLGLSA